jgi:hypothetical protein
MREIDKDVKAIGTDRMQRPTGFNFFDHIGRPGERSRID